LKVNRNGIANVVSGALNYLGGALNFRRWIPLSGNDRPQRVAEGDLVRNYRWRIEEWSGIEARVAEAQAMARFPIAR
jgi:hypothetical protein